MAKSSMQPEHPFENFLRREKIKYLDLRQGDIVLDIGGGSGDVWRQLDCPNAYYFHNVEPDKTLRKRGEDIYTVMYSDITDVPIKSIRQYDVVTLLGLLEHLDNPLDMLKNFGSAKRIYFSVPNALSYHRYVGRQLQIISALDELGPQDLAIGHKRVYTYDTIRDLANKVNRLFDYKFKVSIYTTTFKFLDSAGMMPFVDKFDAMNAAAEEAGIIGKGPYGAEIVVDMKKVSPW